MPLIFAAILALVFFYNVSKAQADYRVCRSQLDGRQYLVCPPERQCFSGDTLVADDPSEHPSCVRGTSPTNAGSCGRHWSK